MLAIQAGLPNQFLAGGDWLHSNLLDRPIQLAGTGFGQTVPVQSLALPENLARMAASEFISDAGIRFKLGRAPPSESLTDSNSAARAFGHRV
ncbi:hypothetical protein PCANC_27618 [Puccinia coronata f. sp. avenae]|uniref:Uncharacterized protein n=1 Tax=Puccinia coronata f. sp. avenae TaxID=200324 RepID=A0A2N5TTU7_9BASI|nr:hypothetical protein PCANC_27618 [Puccinia coronata f. sp. avenae]